MRIILATPFYPPQGGALSTYAAGLEEAFKKQGHDVRVVSFDIRLPPGLRHLAYFLRVFFALRGASFVLSLDTWSAGLPAFYAARARGIPFAVRIGGDILWEAYLNRTREPVLLSEFYDKERPLSFKERAIARGMRPIVRGAAALLFTTRFQREIWKRACGFHDEKARIVENHFPPTIGTYLPATGPKLVCAGRDIALKNRKVLERVVARLQNEHPGLELDTRLLPREEHLRRVAQAHAVVIPSVSEVCSNTAIDAVSLGKPFVMTADTGTKERLAECGLFVDTRSEAEIEQAIKAILDPVTYERLAQKARAFSFTHSWDDIAREILEATNV